MHRRKENNTNTGKKTRIHTLRQYTVEYTLDGATAFAVLWWNTNFFKTHQVHALRITIKWVFWGSLGGCMVCSLVKRVFFVYCITQSTVDCAPRPYLYTRMHLRLWLTKVKKVNQFMLATFSKSIILRRHVVRFWGLVGKYSFRIQFFCYMFKTNYSGHKCLGGVQKIWKAPSPNAPVRG